MGKTTRKLTALEQKNAEIIEVGWLWPAACLFGFTFIPLFIYW